RTSRRATPLQRPPPFARNCSVRAAFRTISACAPHVQCRQRRECDYVPCGRVSKNPEEIWAARLPVYLPRSGPHRPKRLLACGGGESEHSLYGRLFRWRSEPPARSEPSRRGRGLFSRCRLAPSGVGDFTCPTVGFSFFLFLQHLVFTTSRLQSNAGTPSVQPAILTGWSSDGIRGFFSVSCPTISLRS